MRVLLVDHEDSFVHNIEQGRLTAGAEVRCVRATVPLKESLGVDPDAIVLSPGPGHPATGGSRVSRARSWHGGTASVRSSASASATR